MAETADPTAATTEGPLQPRQTWLAHEDVALETETETGFRKRQSKLWRLCRELRQQNPLTFTLASSLIMLTQVNLAVFMVTQLTSLERQFGFTSGQMGQMMSVNEAGYLCLVLPGGYLASKLHVPRTMALLAVGVGAVGVAMGVPHFLFHTSSDRLLADNTTTALSSAASVQPAFCVTEIEVSDERCAAVLSGGHGNATSLDAAGLSSSPQAVYSHRAYPVYVFLLICQVLRGAMGALMFPMFATYIENNAKRTHTGFYLGLLAAIAMLGPAIAFLGGGAISKLHVSLQPTDLTPTNPGWVGAWWLGFLLFGALAAVAPLAMWWFPPSLVPQIPQSPATPLVPQVPQTPQSPATPLPPQAHTDRVTQHPQNGRGSRTFTRKVISQVKGFLVAMGSMTTNPVLASLIFASCLSGFSMNGIYRFMPKYLQHQFHLPAWKANYIMGGAELLCGTSGFFIGGCLTRRLKLTVEGLYRFLLISALVGVLLLLALMFTTCPQPPLSGAPGLSSGRLTNNCSLSCACPEEVFPVCDPGTKENYFSPCHAGCASLQSGVYMNCSCTASGQAYPGVCPSECASVIYFSVLFYVLLFVLSVAGPVNYILIIRCVPTSQTGLAVGFVGFTNGVVASLVGPLVFGDLIDNVCEHWKMPCGVKAQCSVYNNDRFRRDMFLYTVLARALSLALVLVSFLFYRFCRKPTADQTKPTAEEEEKTAEGHETRDAIGPESQIKLLPGSGGVPPGPDIKMAPLSDVHIAITETDTQPV